MHMLDKVLKQSPAVAVICLVFTLLPLYYASWRYNATKHESVQELPRYPPVWSDAFIDAWLDVELIQPFDMYALQQYCKTMKWRPQLIFSLDDANGGIGNIRGNYLDFILQAIEAGASIILPSRATRSTEDFSELWGGRAEFNTFFDEEWFLAAFDEACPQMTIYKNVTEDTKTLEGRYSARSRRTYAEPDCDHKAYLEDLDKWLGAQAGYDTTQKTVVRLERHLWEYDTRGLPYGVRRAMGQILKINPTIRRLAAIVVQQLAKKFYLDLDPTKAIPPGVFFGAHLRTESDAARAGWLQAPNTNFSAQTDAYMQQAVSAKLNVMYVASGNASELTRFKEKAANHKPALNVTSKMDLLDAEHMQELQDLSWDQQALIDYEVLQRCSIFGGFVKSSFSYNIALTRNQWLEDHGLAVDPWIVLHSEEAVAFDDGLSRVIGRDDYHESHIPHGMWP